MYASLKGLMLKFFLFEFGYTHYFENFLCTGFLVWRIFFFPVTNGFKYVFFMDIIEYFPAIGGFKYFTLLVVLSLYLLKVSSNIFSLCVFPAFV